MIFKYRDVVLVKTYAEMKAEFPKLAKTGRIVKIGCGFLTEMGEGLGGIFFRVASTHSSAAGTGSFIRLMTEDGVGIPYNWSPEFIYYVQPFYEKYKKNEISLQELKELSNIAYKLVT